ncbi:MAG: RHS repeat protein, partial [Akkermansiaceae bacterium]|nr:RHS repeat protein [Akkermansiaceae bacterium]
MQPSSVGTFYTREQEVGVGTPDAAPGQLFPISVEGVVDDWVHVDVGPLSYHMPEEEGGDNIPFNVSLGVLPAGTYTLRIRQFNKDFADINGNESYLSLTVYGVHEVSTPDPDPDDEPVGFPGDGKPKQGSCSREDGDSNDGGDPDDQGEAAAAAAVSRSLFDWASTSGGSDVQRSVSAQGMKWSARFGTFRGMADMPVGRLVISAPALGPDASADDVAALCARLSSPAGLVWDHPLASWLALPEEGVQPGSVVGLSMGAQFSSFILSGDGLSLLPLGGAMRSALQLTPVRELSRQRSAGCAWAEARYIRALFVDGSACFYDPAGGECRAYVSADALELPEGTAERYVAVVRDAQGVIRQVWNAWDGLADVVTESAQAYSIRIYAPSQVVSAPGEEGRELFETTGDPLRVFRVQGDAAGHVLHLLQQDNSQQQPRAAELHSCWSWADGAWSMTLGEGESAIETHQEVLRADAEHEQVVRRVSQGGHTASCEMEVYELSSRGRLLLRRTIGYDPQDPAAGLSTEYEYDNRGRLICESSPSSGTRRLTYDTEGRVLTESTPWAGENGWQRVVVTTYRGSSAIFSDEPAQVQTYYITNRRQQVWRREKFSYSEANHLRRVVTEVSGAGSKLTRTGIVETWLPGAPQPYARGRVKLSVAENGVETHYSYASAAGSGVEGALYCVSEETRVGGQLVPGQSRRRESFISAEGNTLREVESALLPGGQWATLSDTSYEYDAFNRRVATHQANGRSSRRALTCQGKLLWEEDADGVRTDYAYNSARQLIETTRSAVYDGDTCITPETITEYTRDALDRITQTTVREGALTRTSRTEYDLQGRITRQVDPLGRITTTSYSADGLTTTETTPGSATLITRRNTDGSTAEQSGSGQRHLSFRYDFDNGLKSSTYAGSAATAQNLLAQSITDAFSQEYIQHAPTTYSGVFLTTRREFNAKGQLVQESTGSLAPVTYEYDSMGQQSRVTTLLDASAPQDPTRNIIATTTYSYEKGGDGEVYQVTTTRRNNAAGEWLTGTQKTLISQLSPTLESKQISTDERGHTTTAWTEYGSGTQRI